MSSRLAALLLSLCLTGCLVGPDYKRPEVQAPAAWRMADLEAQEVRDAAWWREMDDLTLERLVAEALENNRDLLIAAARVEQYVALYGAARADFFPQVGMGLEYDRVRSTERTPNSLPASYNLTYNSFQAAARASWELDLWGKLRRADEAARANLLASEEGRRGTVLSLVASVVSSYVNLRGLDKQMEITRATVELRRERLRLFTLRAQGGLASDVELNQARSEYQQALANLPQLERGVTQAENALSLLLGRNPGSIARGNDLDRLRLPPVPAGLPSRLLERRPDLRQAEQNLMAANAQIGVAKAAYFPSISLTGAFGFASADLSDLFTGPARTWQFASPVSQSIFTAGKVTAKVEYAEAYQKEALAAYLKAIQTAFREVEDYLAEQRRGKEQLAALAGQVEALREYSRLARLRYDNGYTSYLEVLDAERSLFSAELSLCQTQIGIFEAMVNLYKALGGSWSIQAIEDGSAGVD